MEKSVKSDVHFTYAQSEFSPEKPASVQAKMGDLISPIGETNLGRAGDAREGQETAASC